MNRKGNSGASGTVALMIIGAILAVWCGGCDYAAAGAMMGALASGLGTILFWGLMITFFGGFIIIAFKR